MADNYLERKMEALSRGATVIRKDNPSLDTLIHRVVQPREPIGEKVMQAQLDAVARSASLLGAGVIAQACEATQSVTISCNSPEDLGAAVLAARLKAAELGLVSEVQDLPVCADSSRGYCAVLLVRK